MIRQALLVQQEDRTAKGTTILKQFGKGRRNRFLSSARFTENLDLPSRSVITKKTSLAVAENAITLRQEKNNVQFVKKTHLTQATRLGFASSAGPELLRNAGKQKQKKRDFATVVGAFYLESETNKNFVLGYVPLKQKETDGRALRSLALIAARLFGGTAKS